MTTGISTAVAVLSVTLILGSTGLVLFILGLILKTPGKWIPGIVLTLFSAIFGIYGLILLTKSVPARSYSSGYGHTYNYNDPYYEEDDQNEPAAKQNWEQNADENMSRVSGHIQDDDRSLIYIKVFPSPELYQMGIKVIKIDTYNGSGKDKKAIPLEIEFNNKFKGNLQLILYSSGNEELGSSDVQINQEGNTTFTVKFVFDKTADFLKTDHARLKTSD